ncbi:MAG: sigma-70 family RNA polymerase sigma factor [Bacteroidaceae bacterium]|nr:sigma-70 family RNA polymerase sigma factor [Bacteroidaceae bacterium]
MAFLQGTFSLQRVDCENIFQDSFLVLYRQIKEGKLDDLRSSLSTYFNAICRNKAHELLRKRGKELNIIDEYPDTTKSEYEDDRIDKLLALEDDDTEIAERKDHLVRQIVSDMPEPCNNILWGFYRDGFSMKTMAEMFGYKSEGTVKVTKHRCCEKFREHYQRLSKDIFEEDK